MKRLVIVNLITLCLMTLQDPAESPAQSTSSGTSSAPAGNTNSGNTGRSNASRTPNTQIQSPRFISGQVLSGNGQKITDSVSAGLTCGMKTLQSVHAGVDGRFLFTLGFGMQGNADFSAADNSPVQSISSGGLAAGGGAGTVLGTGGTNASVSSLVGCEVAISASGFEPVTRTITQTASLGTVDVGVFVLRQIAAESAGSILITTLKAPGGARNEFEKAVKDLQQDRRDSAAAHLEKAVAQYDDFAAAWYELGRIYAAKDESRARRAYEKAIRSDSGCRSL